MKYILILIFLTNCFYASSQEDKSISKENKTFNELTESLLIYSKGIPSEEIILKGDSLYNASINDWQKVKASFIIVQGYRMQYNWDKALIYALRADSIASKANITSLKPRTIGVLGSLYNNLNLQDKSIEYLNRAFRISEKLGRKEMLINKSLIYQRLASVYHSQKDYDKSLSTNLEALKLMEELEKEFPKENHSSAYISVLLNIGVNYYNLEQYNLSKEYYQKAFKIITSNNHNYYLSYFYLKSAATEIKLNNADSAFTYLQKAKQLANNLKDNNVAFNLNLRLIDYYSFVNDLERSDSLKNKVIESYKDLNTSKAVATQSIILRRENLIEKEKAISSILAVSAVSLLIMVLGVYVYHRKQSRKIKIHFNKIIEEYRNKNLPEEENSPEQQKEETKTTINTSNSEKTTISEEKITELLEKLTSFEKGVEFTAQNFTISTMATLFNTNTKYINYILQQYRGKNFNNYLNEIRIKYIIRKLINEPKFLNYKIEYLSEITGYSNHSYFTQIFKREVQMTPSQFIGQLSERGGA